MNAYRAAQVYAFDVPRPLHSTISLGEVSWQKAIDDQAHLSGSGWTLGLILLATQIVHSAPLQDAENKIREQIVARFAAMEGRRSAAYERFLADSYVSTVEDLPDSKERFFHRGASGQDVFLRDVAGKVTALVWEAANGDIIAHKTKPPSYNADAGATWGRPGPEQGSRVVGKSSPGAQESRTWGEGHEWGEDTGGIVDSAALHQEIQQLSKAWNAAWLENDSATVDRLMASDYVYVAPNGQVLDRRTILGVILSPTYKIHQGTWTELQIKVFSNAAAVIIDRWQGTGTLNGTTFTDDNRCARLCLRRNGTWQIAFEQASPVKP